MFKCYEMFIHVISLINRGIYARSFAFMLYFAMGALRLAKFSVKPTVGHFIGIPITLAGLIMAGMGLFLYNNPIITIILAILMVSPIKIKKF